MRDSLTIILFSLFYFYAATVMVIKFNLSNLISFSLIGSVTFGQVSVLALPLDEIDDILDSIQDGIEIINRTGDTIDDVTEFLGIDGDDEPDNETDDDSDVNKLKKLFTLYATWYKGLSPSEQHLVSWLTLEYAKNQDMNFNLLASRDCFSEQSLEEQAKIGKIYYKFDAIYQAVEDNQSLFFAFAFCVNSGSESCPVHDFLF